MIKKYGDFIAGLCGIILSILLYISAVQIGLKEAKEFGAGFLPQLVAIGLFVCCSILTYRGFHAMRCVKAEEPEYKHFYIGAFGVFIMMVLYAVGLSKVGFVICSILFLFFAMLLATKKENWRPAFFAVLSIVVSVVVYLLFSKVFGIRVPNGLLSHLF
ncbi:MAG: tripartite tricarboxylate transporter TctB family protein [Oscillospiraceae bacterium]